MGLRAYEHLLIVAPSVRVFGGMGWGRGSGVSGGVLAETQWCLERARPSRSSTARRTPTCAIVGGPRGGSSRKVLGRGLGESWWSSQGAIRKLTMTMGPLFRSHFGSSPHTACSILAHSDTAFSMALPVMSELPDKPSVPYVKYWYGRPYILTDDRSQDPDGWMEITMEQAEVFDLWHKNNDDDETGPSAPALSPTVNPAPSAKASSSNPAPPAKGIPARGPPSSKPPFISQHVCLSRHTVSTIISQQAEILDILPDLMDKQQADRLIAQQAEILERLEQLAIHLGCPKKKQKRHHD